jgi:hypothetical protein
MTVYKRASDRCTRKNYVYMDAPLLGGVRTLFNSGSLLLQGVQVRRLRGMLVPRRRLVHVGFGVQEECHQHI